MQRHRQFQLPINGTELCVHEWQGQGTPVFLLHATGFHSRCWNQVVACLPERHIFAADLRFHGASGNDGEVSWPLFCEDIAQLLRELDLTQLVGVGHSIGGHVLARVGAWLPQRFEQLMLIDPVIMPLARYEEFNRLANDIDPADHHVAKRKNQWINSDEMFQRFANREPFSTWDPRVLRDYCDYALTEPDAQGVSRLACDPYTEASVYLSQRGNDAIYRELPDIATAVTLLRAAPGKAGETSLHTSPTWPELASIIPHCEDVFLPHLNHFIPMQRPELVAGYIQSARIAVN